MIEARKGKPGTTLPLISQESKTYPKIIKPSSEKRNPMRVANLRGLVLNPVIMFMACFMSFIVE